MKWQTSYDAIRIKIIVNSVNEFLSSEAIEALIYLVA